MAQQPGGGGCQPGPSSVCPTGGVTQCLPLCKGGAGFGGEGVVMAFDDAGNAYSWRHRKRHMQERQGNRPSRGQWTPEEEDTQ